MFVETMYFQVCSQRKKRVHRGFQFPIEIKPDVSSPSISNRDGAEIPTNQ